MSLAKRSFTIMIASRELLLAPYCPYDFTGHNNIMLKDMGED